MPTSWSGLWLIPIVSACALAQARALNQQEPDWLHKLIVEAATEAGSWDPNVMWEGKSRLYRLDETGSRCAHAQQIIDIKRSSFLNRPRKMRTHVSLMGIGDSQYDFNPRSVQGAGPLPEGFRIVFTIFLGAPNKAARHGDETEIQIILNVNPMPESSYVGSRKGSLTSRPLPQDNSIRPLCGAPANGFTPHVPSLSGLTAGASGSNALTRLLGRTGAARSRAMVALPTMQQAQPAFVACSRPRNLCNDSDLLIKGAYPVVRLNKNYYNPHLSADSIQLVTITPTHADVNPYGAYICQQIWDSLDWSALLKLLRA